MAANRKLFSFFISVILLSSLFFVNEGRLLKGKCQDPIDSAIEKILDELYVEAMKMKGEEGNGTTLGLTLAGIKKSGPSPGQGN